MKKQKVEEARTSDKPDLLDTLHPDQMNDTEYYIENSKNYVLYFI